MDWGGRTGTTKLSQWSRVGLGTIEYFQEIEFAEIFVPRLQIKMEEAQGDDITEGSLDEVATVQGVGIIVCVVWRLKFSTQTCELVTAAD